MINEEWARKYCKEDISLIANYEEAIADKERMWDCHHILELDEEWNTAFTIDELKVMGLYWKQPACLLVFIEHGEHISMHNSGANHPRYGKKLSTDTKQKISTSETGKIISEETKERMRIAHSGKPLPKAEWLTPDGKIVIMAICHAKRFHKDWIRL